MRNTFEVRNHIQKVHLDKKAQDIENKSKDFVEEKGEYECNTCQKVLKTREGIIVHIFNAHEGERNCVFCSEKFTDLHQLTDHIKEKHETEAYRSKFNHKDLF